jgi:hypothetical protein
MDPQPTTSCRLQEDISSPGYQYWTPEEDSILMGCMEDSLPWTKISYLLGKTANQCRHRWKNYIAPNIDNSPLSITEKNKIMELVKRYGHLWTEIARHLPGRSGNMIKNFYYLKVDRRRRHRKRKINEVAFIQNHNQGMKRELSDDEYTPSETTRCNTSMSSSTDIYGLEAPTSFAHTDRPVDFGIELLLEAAATI